MFISARKTHLRETAVCIGFLWLFASALAFRSPAHAQEALPPPAQTDAPPPPKGIEVLARGPVHEAFAAPTSEAIATKPVPKQPPKPLDEMPPAEKPDGNVTWIGGYWGWDDDRKDFLWVSGVWRTPPPGKQWIAGYWREEGGAWQWVPGFWTAAAENQENQDVVYLPKPPEPPRIAPSGQPPTADCFYVPGAWMWNPATSAYAWRAGYWARVQPGYVWVADHYNWTPSGFVYVPGYWDLAVSRRGVLYAPVVVNPTVVPVGFTYTPVYAVSDTVILDTLFIQPAYRHYYFGDYYGPAYLGLGYQSVAVYSGRNYDSIIVYETWAHRNSPNWLSLQINVFNGRSSGTLPLPPRTLVQQNTIVQQNITNITNVTNNTTNIVNNTTNVNRTTTYNTPVLGTTAKIAAAKGVKTVPLDSATRAQAKQQAAAVGQVAAQRGSTERPLPPGAPRQARMASLSVPKAQPVRPGFTAPQVTPHAANNARAAQPLRPAMAPAPNQSVSHSASPGSHPGMTGAQANPAGHPPGITYPGHLNNGSHPGPAAAAAGSAARPSLTPRPLTRPGTPPVRRPPPKETKKKT